MVGPIILPKGRKGETNWDIPLRTELIASSSVVVGIIDFAEKENIDLIVVGTR